MKKRSTGSSRFLTAAGKEHTRVGIPCFSSCRLDGRTIKSNGTIVNLPPRDLIRTKRITEYAAPLTFVRFALPAVEPGDIIEFKATVTFHYPFYIDDFYFAEPNPVIKGVLRSHSSRRLFILLHSHRSKWLRSALRTISILKAKVRRLRTMFTVENVKAVETESALP